MVRCSHCYCCAPDELMVYLEEPEVGGSGHLRDDLLEDQIGPGSREEGKAGCPARIAVEALALLRLEGGRDLEPGATGRELRRSLRRRPVGLAREGRMYHLRLLVVVG